MKILLMFIVPFIIAFYCLFLLLKYRNEPDPTYFDPEPLFDNFKSFNYLDSPNQYTTITSSKKTIIGKRQQYIPRYIKRG